MRLSKLAAFVLLSVLLLQPKAEAGVFQAFDSTDIGSNFDYNDLPWELAVMKNH